MKSMVLGRERRAASSIPKGLPGRVLVVSEFKSCMSIGGPLGKRGDVMSMLSSSIAWYPNGNAQWIGRR